LRDENGQQTSYSYVTSPGNIRYEAGGLKEGVYRYTASTTINGKHEEVKGEFAVVAPQSELQNLTADFDLLRKISQATGGKFYTSSQITQLEREILSRPIKSTIHTEEAFDSLLNLKSVFWILVILISLEWFIRKYFGSY